MRWKSTITLILLNVAIFVFIFKYGKRSNPIASEQLLFAHKMQNVEWLEISGKILPQKRLLKRNRENWFLEEPVVWPANNFAVQHILSQLRYLEKEVSFSVEDIEASGQSLEDYGLKDPSLTIRFGNGEEEHTLFMGQPAKIGQRIYILDPETDNVLVVNQSLRDSLLVDMKTLRNPRFLWAQTFEINSIKIKSEKDKSIVLLEKNQENWDFVTPIRTQANTKAVDLTLTNLVEADAESFLSGTPNLSEFGLESPSATLAFQGTQIREVLLLGNKVPDKNCFYLKRENNNAVFTAPIKLLAPFLAAQEALRDPRVLHFNPKTLNRIEISGNDKEICLEKLESGTWQLLEKKDQNIEAYPIDEAVFSNLIIGLQGVEATRFVNDAPSASDLKTMGFDSPRRKVKLFSDESKETLLITGEDKQGTGLFAKTKNSPFVYEIPRWILEDLRLNPLHYREKVIEKLPEKAEILSIKIETNDKTFFVEKEKKVSWEAKLETFSEQQKEALFTLIGNLHELDCQEILQESFASPFQLDSETPIEWTFKLTASIHLPGKDEEETLTLVFSDRLGGTLQLGGYPEKSVVFSLKQELIDALENIQSLL